MSEQEARKLVASLTHEEKQRLLSLLKYIEHKKGGIPCQTKN